MLDSWLDGKRLCVITPDQDVYSETFIHHHIEHLSSNPLVLSGGYFPMLIAGRGTLQSKTMLLRETLANRGFRFSLEQSRTQRLAKILKRERVKAVLAEYGPTGAEVSEACSLARIPLIVHFHGFDAFDQRILSVYKESYQQMFSTAAAIIAVSREMETSLLQSGAPVGSLFYRPYGVDISVFSGAAPETSGPRFLAVGRFVDKKGPVHTLLAFEQVVRSVPKAILQMIGDGELLEATRQVAKSLGVGESVHFNGVRSQTEIADAMRGSRAFVQHSLTPSYGDAEGTPVAIIEAASSGLPVISTIHGGIPDVVVDGETGFLVEEGDIASMSRRMSQLARDPNLAGEMGRRAASDARRRFSLPARLESLAAIIKTSSDRSTSAN